MSRASTSQQSRIVRAARIPLGLLVAGALSVVGIDAGGEGRPDAPRAASRVNAIHLQSPAEKTFWACDYAATTRLMDADEAAACSTNYEDLKNGRFDGDFRAMLEWWKKNKLDEHRAVAAAEAP